MLLKNIVVLGGAGDMGSRVVRELHGSREVHVTVADYRVDRAKKLAGELGGEVSAVFVDANDMDSLQAALAGKNLAVNCIGPFYKYAFKIASAAIQAGVSYIDICDDDDATMALLSLDAMARRKNVILIIGVGWTPGISNLLAAYAAGQMDVAEDIDMTWVGSASDSEGIAVIKHVFHAVTRNTPMYNNCEWVDVPALSGVKNVTFPAPIGTVPAYFCGHPEPVTIPRFIDGVRNVTLRGYLLPADINQLTKLLITLEMLNSEEKFTALADFMQPLLPILSNFGGASAPPVSGIRVDVTGLKDGKKITKSYCSADSMERLTGIPPAIAALMFLRGQVTVPPGVYAPEGCFDPVPFFEELARRGIKIEEAP
ncbi:MAG: saccharopine dehydrogenase family protein [Bacillota bacterium]